VKYKALIKKAAIISVAVIAISMAVVFIVLGFSLNAQIGKKADEAALLETRLFNARRLIDSARTGPGSDGAAPKHTASLAIEEITACGSSQKVNFISFSPGQTEENKDLRYKILPVDMQITATYQNLGLFLGLLNELKSAIVTIESLKVFPYSEGTAATCKAEIKLNIYLFHDTIVPPQANAKRTAFAKWKKDAFVRKQAPVEISTDFVLNGIMWDEESPQAIINGIVVSPGETIGTFTVTEIQQEAVVLSDGSTRLELKLE